jgi:hypothetical protein
MLEVRQVHHEVPELRSGYDEATAFADFCRFLAGGAVESEARAFVQAAQALLEATTRELADGGLDEAGPWAPRQRRRS